MTSLDSLLRISIEGLENDFDFNAAVAKWDITEFFCMHVYIIVYFYSFPFHFQFLAYMYMKKI